MPNPFDNPDEFTDSQSTKSDKSALSTESAEISEDFVSTKNISELADQQTDFQKPQENGEGEIEAVYRDYVQNDSRERLKEKVKEYFGLSSEFDDRVVEAILDALIEPKAGKKLTSEDFKTSWEWMFNLMNEWWSLSPTDTKSAIIKAKDMCRVVRAAYKDTYDKKYKNDSISKAKLEDSFSDIPTKFTNEWPDESGKTIGLHIFLKNPDVKNAI